VADKRLGPAICLISDTWSWRRKFDVPSSPLRNSPSVTGLQADDSWLANGRSADFASSIVLRICSSLISPLLKRAPRLDERLGRSRLPTWSSRKGGTVHDSSSSDSQCALCHFCPACGP